MLAEDIVKLFDYLPKEASSGLRDQDAEGGSFTTGLYCRVKVSLRRNVRLFPNSTKVLATFVRQVHPDQKFTSIILFDSVATSMHTDALNAPCDNLVIGLSRFEGGDLWTEWPASAPHDPRLKYETRSFDSGSTLGALLPVSKHPVLFCAKSLKHETCPFRGRRVVLVAYSLQAADQVNSSDQELLKSLNFNWPRPCDLQNPNLNPPRILHGTDEAPRVVPSIAQVFAGDGSLISGFRRIGWHTLSIDCSVAPGRHKHQPLVCELSAPAAQEFALRILQDFGPSVIYIRPPCRTANRARSRPLLTSHPAADKCPPLRSGDMPWGLDDLSPRQKAQVETENRLFRFSAKVLSWALERGAFVCLENPETSLFWECLTSTPEFCRAKDSLKSLCADLCMLGGSRPASVKFVTNLPSLGPLLRKCPGSGPQHKHTPFGFLSGQENHPPAFVQSLVHACCEAVSFSPPAERIRPGDEVRQARRSRQLMPEFHTVKWRLSAGRTP